MSTRRPSNLPVALSTARGQFDRWRSRHRPRARLPEELWHQAVTLAREYGLNKTASALGLKYYSLQKHVNRTASEESERGAKGCEFLELLPGPTTTASIECTIELEETAGTTMRMHVQGVSMTDLVSFACGFRSRRS